MFKWISGRQGGGYDKLPLLISKLFKCDLYLLRFPEGSEVKLHKDAVDSGKHYRLNIILKKPELGGEIWSYRNIIKTKRIQFFRPDENWHCMTKIRKGNMLIFSLGFVKD